jgi:spermidine synthase
VQCALWHRAKQVDVVEINEDSIAAVRGLFDRWLGGIGSDPRVRYHHQDGRSFAHQARGAGYDLGIAVAVVRVLDDR